MRTRSKGWHRLDAVCEVLEYLPITTSAMRQAALFWAIARQKGQPTAHDSSIDGDMILAAQAKTLGESGATVATTNVGHLSRFVDAVDWPNITSTMPQ